RSAFAQSLASRLLFKPVLGSSARRWAMSGDFVDSAGDGDSSTNSQRRLHAMRCRFLRAVGGWVCTHNPFYAVSAALVFAGLRISFGPEGHSQHLWGLAAGVAGYALLLTVTSILLVRLGQVWDDVRSLLLIIVLMLVAMSSSVDEILVKDFNVGAALLLGGLVLAVSVSESVLRGLRIRLAAPFRISYYLMLALFFVYPIIVVYPQFAPGSHALHWTLFGFSAAVALAVLTLLSAACRGRRIVAHNGSPWNWPWYPWPVFVTLGLFAIWRTYSLCIAFDSLGGSWNIFGAYFLTLPCLAVAAVVLETAIESRSRFAATFALALAGLAPMLAGFSRVDPVYNGFVDEFVAQLGCSPLFAALCLSALFYAIASLRRIAGAADLLSANLALVCFVMPTSQQFGAPSYLTPACLLTVAALQLLLATLRRRSGRALVAAACATIGVTICFDSSPAFVNAVAAQAMLLATMIITLLFNDPLARWLRRRLAAVLVIANALWLMGFGPSQLHWPDWAVTWYPVAWVLMAVGYGWLLNWRPMFRAAAWIAVLWLGVHGTRGYRDLRMVVAGLDLLAGGAVFFLAALFISLCKASAVVRATAARLVDGDGG
ncbi:MAG TPA: hypothetical protein VHV77_05400, partial [Pirellulales bacterium]|nr:hypothetical protein [Pirellulales bacterium]